MGTRGTRVAPAPGPLGSFVGRRQELTRLRTLLSETRLVTVAGPGGAGKTRLAEELAAGMTRSFQGAIAFAYLAAAQTAAEVLDLTAAAVGIRGSGQQDLRQQLTDYCAAHPYLLVLDNCEHVAGPAAELAACLVASCPRVRILATSRRPLHVPGEQIFPLGGLGTEAATLLFVDRARRAIPDLALDGTARSHVARICSRLESMPLAVELAAAQVRSIGLAELAERVERDASGLSTRSILAPERQRTLRHTVAWSHDLMDEPQRIVWRRLGVFSGGFTLAAAERVVALPPIDAAAVPDLLGDLVDQSMVVFDAATDRYRLIEVLREFAHERLEASGEEARVTEQHRRWLVDLVGECDRRWYGPDQPRILDVLEREGANLRAALERCRREHADLDGLRLANGAFFYWLARASLVEGSRWYAEFLGRSGDPALEARSHWRAGYLATITMDLPLAERLLARASAIIAETGDPVDRAYARVILALALLWQHPEEHERARRLAQETATDPTADAMARSWASIVLALRALALHDFAACRDLSLAAETPTRAAGDLWSLERILLFLAHGEWQLGELAAAEAHLIESVGIARTMDDLGHLAWAADALGWVTLDRGNPARAARLLGIADSAWIRSGAGLAEPWRPWRDSAMTRLSEALGAKRLAAEMGAGRDLAHGAAFAYVLDESPPASPRESRSSDLSARELEVAALVADGLGNRAIAERLFLSPRTVEKHIEHLMNKIGVDSRAAVAAWHARSGTTSH